MGNKMTYAVISPTTLPYDILYDVLCHSSVRDILSFRQVSRKLYHLTHHRHIWVNAYARCPLLLPPGPFSYQSAVDIERSLKKSHLLEENWTSPSPRPVSRQTFAIADVRVCDNCMKLVGRYLLVAGLPRFRCYDLESKNEELAPIAAYDSIETIFDCVVEKYSVVDNSDCHLLCALKSQPRDERIGEVTLLRLHISQFSAKFELMKEVRLPRPIYRRVRIIGDILAMESTYHGPMLLHIPTCQVYDLPPCDFSSDYVRSTFVVTSNHLICNCWLGFAEMLEVFPLPRGAAQLNGDDKTPSVHILTRSHSSIHFHHIRWTLSGLLAERHDLHNNDHSGHYTLIAANCPEAPRLGFLDIYVVSGSVTTTWTDAVKSEDEHGYWEQIHVVKDLFAFTVSEDGDGRRVVRSRRIDVQRMPVFDGVQGRMCHLVSSGHIEVIDFV